MNPVVDAGGYADISLRIQLTGNGDADLQPETRPNTDAYQISAYLAKGRSLASPTMTKRVGNEIFLLSCHKNSIFMADRSRLLDLSVKFTTTWSDLLICCKKMFLC